MNGWSCSKCTFYHDAPTGNRCAMCDELRITKAHMRDFIQGIPIPSAVRTNPVFVSQKSVPGNHEKSKIEISKKSSFEDCNPYSKKKQSSANILQGDQSRKGSAILSQKTLLFSSNKTGNFNISKQNSLLSQSTTKPIDLEHDTQNISHKSEQINLPGKRLTINPYFKRKNIPDNDSSVLKIGKENAYEPGKNSSSSISRESKGSKDDNPTLDELKKDEHDKNAQRSFSSRPKEGTDFCPSLQPLKNTDFSHDIRMSTSTENSGNKVMSIPTNTVTVAKTKGMSRPKSRLSLPHQFLPYSPGPVTMNVNHASNWVYPVDEELYPQRDYQVEITESAIFHNTLVSLPTGLGKTLIAAVVLYNFYRWFDEGKVIFMAPTLPLVHQQVKACYEIMGIPQNDTHVLTGKMSPTYRSHAWQSKRVFFCTPQTVQKDLEANRFDASSVVCLVLDEAHKATGDYAYVKVIELLERGGAMFRILGLSATPGTNIKAIQLVADALRINKIECRQDSDPDVAQYIHQRVTEVVIVPQVDASKQIERGLNDIVAPLLEKLKDAGAIRVTDNASITAYSLIYARDQYMKQSRDQSLVGCFLAAYSLVQIRSDLHKHGIGMVRTKFMRLLQERQRGMMATIVQTTAFQKLWDQVKVASFDQFAASSDGSSKLMNNPKLTKLQEILLEHFERARACNTSSRSIVFSQFRDSVSEIVSVLEASQPLIRPRRFIGQNKGKAKTQSKAATNDDLDETSSTHESANQLMGMNQNEQQKVIRQFKEGVYNVLVCTCIGEEGLDIGEVDLIVNFDTLRSPIRMLQRVGRTGRKRDGRVVCLVAEGPEEKTLVASKQCERNLNHALKNPKSFKVIPTRTLFPCTPVRMAMKMLIKQNFQMSQVNCVAPKTKKRLQKEDDLVSTEESKWQLDPIANNIRLRILTDSLSGVHLDYEDHQYGILPSALTRRFLASRTSSLVHRKKGEAFERGIGTTLLRFIEKSHGEHASNLTAKKSFHSYKIINSLEMLFPADRDDRVEDTCGPHISTDNGVDQSTCGENKENTEKTDCGRSEDGECPYEDHFQLESCEDIVKIPVKQPDPTSNFGTLNPYKRQNRIETVSSNVNQLISGQFNRTGSSSSNKSPVSTPFSLDKIHDDTVFDDQTLVGNKILSNIDLRQENLTASEGKNPSPTHTDSTVGMDEVCQVDECGMQLNQNETISAKQSDDFYLPPASDSSSSSDSNESGESDDEDLPGSRNCDEPMITDAPLTSASKGPQQGAEQCLEDMFLLPPQDSSSDDDSESDHGSEESHLGFDDDKENTDIQTEYVSGILENSCDEGTNDLKRGGQLCLLDSTVDSVSTSCPHKKRKGNSPDRDFSTRDQQAVSGTIESLPFNIYDYTLETSQQAIETTKSKIDISQVSNFECGFDESPEDFLLGRKKYRGRICAIIDSPIATRTGIVEKRSRTALSDKPYSRESDFGLCNTQVYNEVVCAVCQNGESLDEDPIVLCDGAGQHGSCNVAVHFTCYSVPEIIRKSDEWRCDPCEFRRNGGVASILCALCGNAQGALKQKEVGYWQHVRCVPNIKRETIFKTLQQKAKASRDKARELPKQKLIHNKYVKSFIEEEAKLASDQDTDGDESEEEMVKAIEEEEALMSGFINDSSQLGYSPDELDRIDPSIRETNDCMLHQKLDTEREKQHLFATPIFNRRMLRKKNVGTSESMTPASAPESEKGLGNMNFIRSVLEHHRNGGNVDDIEKLYDELLEENVNSTEQTQLD